MGLPVDVKVDAPPVKVFRGKSRRLADQAISALTGIATSQGPPDTEAEKDSKVVVTLHQATPELRPRTFGTPNSRLRGAECVEHPFRPGDAHSGVPEARQLMQK